MNSDSPNTADIVERLMNACDPRTGDDWPDFHGRVKPVMHEAAAIITGLRETLSNLFRTAFTRSTVLGARGALATAVSTPPSKIIGRLRHMTDDREGLYSHTSEAVADGRSMGRHEMYLACRRALSKLSVKYEPLDDPAKFHVAEEACRVVREAMEEMDKPRIVV